MRLPVFVLFLFSIFTVAQTPCSQMISDAEDAVKKGDYKAAILKFQAAQKCDPQRVQEIDEAILNTFYKIESLKKQSERQIQELGNLLGDITDLLQRDENASIIGMAELENEIFDVIAPSYKFVKSNASNSDYQWKDARVHFRIGSSRERMGKGGYTEEYEKSFQSSINAVETFNSKNRKVPEALMKTLLDAAQKYSWHLMNRGSYEEAENVLMRTNKVVPYYTEKSAQILDGLSGIENALSRLYSKKEEETERLKHNLKALELMEAAAKQDSNNIIYQNGLAVLNKNMSLLPDSIMASKVKAEYLKKGCDLAEKIRKVPGSGTVAVVTVANCMYDNSLNLISSGKYEEATALLIEARDELTQFIHLDPDNKEHYPIRALILSKLGQIADYQEKKEKRLEYLIAAKNDWVKIFEKGSVLPNDMWMVTTVYDRIIPVLDLLPTKTDAIDFLVDIATAFDQSAEAYGDVDAMGRIAADCFLKLGERQRIASTSNEYSSNMSPKFKGLGEYFARAIEFYEKQGVLDDINTYTDNFHLYCKAYYAQLQHNRDQDNIEAAVAGLDKMQELFKPVLEKHPYDYYLRQYFWLSNMVIGDWYYHHKRFKEATPFLQYASKWGESQSIMQLASIYEKAEGVGKSDSIAIMKNMAVRQDLTDIKLLCDLNGSLSVYTIYVRQYPDVFPFSGIQDQAQWLKYARGAIVPEETISAFDKLYDLAIANKISYPELCTHFVMATEGKDVGNYDKVAPQDSISLEIKQHEYDDFLRVFRSSPRDSVQKGDKALFNKVVNFHLMMGDYKKAEDLAREQILFNKDNSDNHRLLANIQLQHYENEKDDNRDINLLLDSNELAALGEYYRHFLKRLDIKDALIIQKRILQVNSTGAVKYVLFRNQNQFGLDLFDELFLTGDAEKLEDDIAYFKTQSFKNAINADKAFLYGYVIRMEDHLLTLKSDSATIKAVGTDYNSLAWYQLLTGKFKESEETIKKGLKIDSGNLFFYTNLPPVKLLQGDYAGARKLYLALKDKPFSVDERFETFKDAFLDDFQTFKKEGVIPKKHEVEVNKTIALLKGADIAAR